MRTKIPHVWESMDKYTERCKVIGGWLVKHHSVIMKGDNHLSLTESMCFIKDVDHMWIIQAAEVKDDLS